MGHFVTIKNGKIDHFFVILGIFDTTIRSNNLLGLNWTQKALLLIFIVYYSKQYILKSMKGKGT